MFNRSYHISCILIINNLLWSNRRTAHLTTEYIPFKKHIDNTKDRKIRCFMACMIFHCLLFIKGTLNYSNFMPYSVALLCFILLHQVYLQEYLLQRTNNVRLRTVVIVCLELTTYMNVYVDKLELGVTWINCELAYLRLLILILINLNYIIRL